MPIRPPRFAGFLLAILLPCSVAADDWVTSYYKQPTPDRFVVEVRALANAGALSDGNTARSNGGFSRQGLHR